MIYIVLTIIAIFMLFLFIKNNQETHSPQTSQTPQPTYPSPSPTPSYPTQPITPTPPTQPTQTLTDRVIQRWNLTHSRNIIESVSNSITDWCERLDLVPEYIAAVAMTESSYGRNTSNPYSSARGVMQITRDTWETISNLIRLYFPQYSNYIQPFTYADDINTNILYGCVYMRHLLNRVSQAFAKAHEFNDYLIASYAYYRGPTYITRIQNRFTYNEAINILLSGSEQDPIFADGIQYVRRILNYYRTLIAG